MTDQVHLLNIMTLMKSLMRLNHQLVGFFTARL